MRTDDANERAEPQSKEIEHGLELKQIRPRHDAHMLLISKSANILAKDSGHLVVKLAYRMLHSLSAGRVPLDWNRQSITLLGTYLG